MKIVFCDSNIVFGLFCTIQKGIVPSTSILIQIGKHHDIYISDFVIGELSRNYSRDTTNLLSKDDVLYFLQVTGFKVISSVAIDPNIIRLLNDKDDIQILQDAATIKADYLITNNLKDFNIQGIFEQLHIKVVNTLPDEILESLI